MADARGPRGRKLSRSVRSLVQDGVLKISLLVSAAWSGSENRKRADTSQTLHILLIHG